MLSPARRPRPPDRGATASQAHLLRPPIRTARIRRADGGTVRPRKIRAAHANPQSRKRDKFRLIFGNSGARTHLMRAASPLMATPVLRSSPTDRENSSSRQRKCSAATGRIRATHANARSRKKGRANCLRSRAAQRGKFGFFQFVPAPPTFPVQKRGLTTLSPITIPANVQSASSVDRAVCPLF
jgi:hypothetical protein